MQEVLPVAHRNCQCLDKCWGLVFKSPVMILSELLASPAIRAEFEKKAKVSSKVLQQQTATKPAVKTTKNVN